MIQAQKQFDLPALDARLKQMEHDDNKLRHTYYENITVLNLSCEKHNYLALVTRTVERYFRLTDKMYLECIVYAAEFSE